MARWLLLTVFSMAWSLAGCASSVRPGLANVRLDGLGVADDRVADVVANGDDSCGRHGEDGPLRGRWPPCPAHGRVARATVVLPRATSPGESLVVPWLEHFYTGWPCAHPIASIAPAHEASETKTLAWTAAPSPAHSCGEP
jgi:hypothetical protein